MKKYVFLILSIILCLLIIVAPFSASASSALASVEFNNELNCTSVQLINLDTDTVVFEKDPDLEVEPVFLTKILIALLTIEAIAPPASASKVTDSSSSVDSSAEQSAIETAATENEQRLSALESVKITASGYIFSQLSDMGSSSPNIREGETLSAYQLLNMLMVTSGNDAAMILADYLGSGSIPDCIDRMNERAKQLGAVNTFFTNAHGFHDPEQITTVKDIYRIVTPLLTDGLFLDIVSQSSYTLPATNKNEKQRTYRTTNLMMDNTGSGYYYQPIKGIKTGRTDDSGFCFLGYTDWGNVRYLCIAMGAPVRDKKGNILNTNGALIDTRNLCSWAYNNLEIKTIVDKDQSVTEVPIKYAFNMDRILLVTNESFTTIVPKNLDLKSVVLIPEEGIPEELEAPVEEGQVVGKAKVTYANQELGTVTLAVSQTVDRNTMQVVSDILDSIFSSVWIIICVGILVVALILYVLSAILKNRRNRRRVNRRHRNTHRF